MTKYLLASGNAAAALTLRGDHLLLLEFNMLAAEVEELESLTWQWVRNVRIRIADEASR